MSPPPQSTTTTPLWTSQFVSLLLANGLLCAGFYMLPSTLPAYVKQLGSSDFQSSLVIGTFSILSLFSRIFASSAVDAVGEKSLIVGGIATIALTTLAFIWLPVDGIILLRAVQGIGWGLATAAIATAVYKVVPEARRGEGSGYYALTVIAALALTPLIAILLQGLFGQALLLSISVLLTCASLPMLKGGLKSISSSHQHTARKISVSNIFEPGAVIPSLLCFLNSIPLCGIMAYLVLFSRTEHIDTIWVFFIGYAAMILVTRPYIGRLLDRRGHRVIVLPGCLSMIIGLWLLSLTDTTALLVASSLFYGLGYGAVHPTLQTWAVNRCPADRKAAANGLYLSAIDLGYIVGAMALGMLGGSFGYRHMYALAIVPLLVFMALYAYALRHPETDSPVSS